MPDQPKRRFLGLETDEVSLVDSPANEVEFLVAKNRGDSEMADGKTKAADSTASEVEVEKVAVDVETGDSDQVTAALKSVTQIVDSIAGVVKAAKGDETANTETTKADDSDGEEDTAKAGKGGKGKPKFLLAKEEAEAEAKAKEEAEAKAKADKEAEAKRGKGMKKADDDLPADGEADTEKAKAFTPARISQIEGALKTLQGLLQSVKGEVKEAATEKQADPSSDALAQFGPVLEGIATTLKSVGEGMTALTERVCKIEGTRPASNSAEESDDGTDAPVAKNQDMWSGLL